MTQPLLAESLFRQSIEALPGENELPYCDGVPMDSEVHGKQMTILTSSLQLAWADRNDFYVGGDMFIYYSEVQTKKNDFRGPDVFVVLNTVRRARKSWVVWGEDGRMPDVVIEVVSPTTEDIDRGEKKRIYSKCLRVSNYYIYDPDLYTVDGYQLDPDSLTYVPIDVDAMRALPCPALGLHLGIRPGLYQGLYRDWLRWIGPDGEVLPTSEEQALIAQLETRAAHEQTRAANEQTRAAQERAWAAEQRALEETKQREATERRLAEALEALESLRTKF